MPKEPFEKQPLPIRKYVIAATVLGALGLLTAVIGTYNSRISVEHLVIAILAAIVIELVPLEEVVSESVSETTLSESIHLAAIAILGYAPAVLVGVASCAISEITRKRDWYKGLFNASMVSISIVSSGLAFLTISKLWTFPPALLAIPFIVSAITYRLISSTLLAGIPSLKRHRSFVSALIAELSADLTAFASAATMGMFAVYLYSFKPAYSLLSLPPIIILSIAFRNARKLSAEVSVHKKEFARAREVQQNLMSMTLVNRDEIDISFKYVPYCELSGDFFDIVQVGNAIHFAIGDAMGKGTPAALAAAYHQGSLRLLLADRDTAETLRALNRIVFDFAYPEAFFSIFCARYCPDKGLLYWSNAGHPPALLVNSRAEKTYLLSGDGIALGAHPDATYEERVVSFGQGDVMVIYTDGVTEAPNASRNPYGIDRLVETVVENRSRSADDIAQSICEDVENYTARNISDDLTVVVLKGKKTIDAKMSVKSGDPGGLLREIRGT